MTRILTALTLLAAALLAPPTAAGEPVLGAPVITALKAMKPMTPAPLGKLEGKVVVVSFFASWCPPCTDEFHQLNKLRAAFPAEKLAIVSLNLFEDFFENGQEARMKRFLKRTAPAFPVLGGLGDDDLSALFGGVERIPTVFIFDRRGRAVFRFIHEVDATKRHANFDEMKAAIQPLLAGG
ncbi:MAG: TlpA disulfide reductase family protein [Magnetovibrio sp.]|nr:TlpA disulfide reductase family protein [Magnetovibrio sp.]